MDEKQCTKTSPTFVTAQSHNSSKTSHRPHIYLEYNSEKNDEIQYCQFASTNDDKYIKTIDSYEFINHNLSQLQQLTIRCQKAIREYAKNYAKQKHMSYIRVIGHENAIELITKSLPQTEAALLQIQHITQTIVDTHGAEILQITHRFYAEQLNILTLEDTRNQPEVPAT